MRILRPTRVPWLGNSIRPWLCSALLFAADDPRPAETILREFDAVGYPGFFSGMEKDQLEREVRKSADRQIALSQELWRDHPRQAELPRVLATRWALLRTTREAHTTVREETSRVLQQLASADPAWDEALGEAAALEYAAASLRDETVPLEEKRRAVEAAERRSARDAEWMALLWSDFARLHVSEPDDQRTIAAHVVKHYGKAFEAVPMAHLYRFTKKCGRPLPALETVDLLTGAPFHSESTVGTPTLWVLVPDLRYLSSDAPDVLLDVERHARSLKDRGLRLVVVSSADDVEAARAHFAVTEAPDGLSWTVVQDPIGEEFGVATAGSWTRSLEVPRWPGFVQSDAEGNLVRYSERLDTLLREP